MANPQQQAMPSPKQQFLNALDKEHATTVKVLRAFPADKAAMKPHEKLKSAKDLAFIFVLERGLGVTILNNEFAQLGSRPFPATPDRYEDILAALEQANAQFRSLVESFSDQQMMEKVTFLVGPKTPGQFTRLEFCWFLLCDEIHHRGQFSVYLRLADAKVPSIYGPTADEPWM
jgi:uncharacterized damage-inducible protein DinB